MEWLDCKSVAVLLDVSEATVRNWCRDKKLASIKKSGFFRNPDIPPGRPGGYGRSRKIFIARVDLQEFLMRYWYNGKDGRKAVSIKTLIELGQEDKEIAVKLSPDEPSQANLKMLGLAARYSATKRRLFRELSPGDIEGEQGELFPEYANRHWVVDNPVNPNL